MQSHSSAILPTAADALAYQYRNRHSPISNLTMSNEAEDGRHCTMNSRLLALNESHEEMILRDCIHHHHRGGCCHRNVASPPPPSPPAAAAVAMMSNTMMELMPMPKKLMLSIMKSSMMEMMMGMNSLSTCWKALFHSSSLLSAPQLTFLSSSACIGYAS